jgi:hypothetical protein
MSSSCDFHIVLYRYSGIRCHFHTPVGLCCYESSMRPYKVFLAVSLPTLIAASCRLYLRHYCRLDLSSCRTTGGIIVDLWLTATFPLLSPNNVGRTSSLHYYYLAFVVLTYLAYLIAVNTSYRSSLVLHTWVYKPSLY